MGAASAAEDISADAVDDAIDDVVLTDEVVDADLPRTIPFQPSLRMQAQTWIRLMQP